MTRSDPDPAPPARLRADKWLWHARFFKTRGLASELVTSGRLRVNGERVSKPAHGLQPGDTLTFPQGRELRVVRVVALSKRRGPAVEAQTLYLDLEPPNRAEPGSRQAVEPRVGARPTKKDRRRLDQTRPSLLE